jgi:uncharacterized repeat protein (TIGR01451 family)
MTHDATDGSTRWLRILAIAVAAIILASCRSLPPVAADGCPPAACETCETCETCGPVACVCPPRPVPVVRPCLVCDGGDHGAPARPVGDAGLANLTAGDTVARFRPADEGPDADCVDIAVASCACVYAPRFASVREVVKPFEDARPEGPRGLALDERVGEESERLPPLARTQPVGPQLARKRLPGVALEERLGPLAVDQAALPREDDSVVQPVAHALDDAAELARTSRRPLAVVGFDVPIAWTRVQAANVLSDGREPRVVASDRGTATLRFEEPGRAELTLCKRAGSDTAKPGEELDFTIVLLNSGDRPLTDIVLFDAVPQRLDYIPGSAAANLPAAITTETADDGSTVVKWRFTEPLPAGASGFVRFRTLVR